MPKRLAALALLAVAGCGGLAAGAAHGGADGGGGGAGSSSGSGGGSSGGGGAGSSGGASSSGGSSGGAPSGAAPANHRPSDAACHSVPPPGTCTAGNPRDTCSSDAECANGANGRCVSDNSGSLPYCTCTYDACAGDADCASGKTCACHGSAYTEGAGNTCTASNCRVDSDCGPPGYCSPSVSLSVCNGASVSGYYCHTSSDECQNDADCPQTPVGPGACAYSIAAGRWQCTGVPGCE
jgi:hypothetical protein